MEIENLVYLATTKTGRKKIKERGYLPIQPRVLHVSSVYLLAVPTKHTAILVVPSPRAALIKER